MKKLATNYILRRLATLQVTSFSEEEFRRLFQLTSAQGYQVLHRLAAEGYLARIARGRYIVLGVAGSPAAAQPFYVGTRLVEPSYVSFWSALHYYAWTEQAPRLVSIATTKISTRWRVGAFRFRFVKLRASRFFGYALGAQGTVEFPVAEPEKAIVDALFLPQASGGTDLVASALAEAVTALDIAKLQRYGTRMASRSLASRLGYLLERSGVEAQGLLPDASSVYVKLDPRRPRRGQYNARWNILDNLPEAG